MDAPRICLNMIVRNETAIIRRALESAAEHIAYWVISDTGSIDDTKALISAFFAERGIAGEFADAPFDTFEGSRNRALDAARASSGAFEYILLMDADMQLQVDDPAFRKQLTAPLYMMEQRAGIAYWNARLLRRDMPSRYRGVTHEYLDGGGQGVRLSGAWFLDGADGANRQGKFERDIALLLGGLEKEPDNARYVYYLAQSYRDAGQDEKAAEAYARRFAMGGWDEERWSALLNEARCWRRLGDIARFLDTAARAFDFRPKRAEPLYDLALHHRQAAEYETAMAFAELASHIPYPAEDRLFIEAQTYAYGIRQEISIAGFYCASPEQKNLGRLACNDLAIDPGVPPAVRAKARENLAYYARRAGELMPSFVSRQLAWQPPFAGSAMNPSIVNVGGTYRLIVRVVNYTTTNAIDFVTPNDEPVATRNLLLDLDTDLVPQRAAEILPPVNFPTPRFPQVLGFEDLRPFAWRGELWGIATVRELNSDGWCEMVLARIVPDGGGAPRLADWRVLTPEAPRQHQKNWMPLVSGDWLEFVYSAGPTRIVSEDGRTVRESSPPTALDHLRGGSQLVPFDCGWLALMHEVARIGGGRVYMHRFVWFDGDVRPQRISEAFHFHGRGIEFAAGLCWHNDGERLIVSYGVGDASAWLATVSAADVRAAIRSVADQRAEATAPAA